MVEKSSQLKLKKQKEKEKRTKELQLLRMRERREAGALVCEVGQLRLHREPPDPRA